MAVLDAAVEAKVQHLDVYGDSQLVVRQVNGEWLIKAKELVPQAIIRAVSSHITYEPANGHLEVLSKDTSGREAMARTVADALLQSPITGEKIPLKQYDYQSLCAARNFDIAG